MGTELALGKLVPTVKADNVVRMRAA